MAYKFENGAIRYVKETKEVKKAERGKTAEKVTTGGRDRSTWNTRPKG